MKEIPILFNTEMVRALDQGRKTQTRRIIKDQEAAEIASISSFHRDIHAFLEQCPKGQPGDVLWVRESFLWLYDEDEKTPAFKANIEPDLWCLNTFKPSIHMPKAIARIWLQIESVGFERINEISAQDAIAEGIEKGGRFYRNYNGAFEKGSTQFKFSETPISSFRSLWNSIHQWPNDFREGPWVWVLKFKVLSTTGKPAEWPGKQLDLVEQAATLSNQAAHE